MIVHAASAQLSVPGEMDKRFLAQYHLTYP